jgi:primase-polymerase (primpol)-like protein
MEKPLSVRVLYGGMTQQTVPPDMQRVPLVLRRTSHWVVWRYEENPEKRKPNKVPYNPRSRSHEHPWHASVTKPRSWGSFGDAVRALSSGSYTGIGFVFHDSNPFCGIDLDNCLDTETLSLNAWAQEIVAQMGSYSEWSPSGTGIHILVEASLPVSGMNRKGVGLEMYVTGRFFTITGKRLVDSPEDILPRYEAVMALYLAYAVAETTTITNQVAEVGSAGSFVTQTQPTLTEQASPPERSKRGRAVTTPDDLSDEELLEKAMNPERADGRDFARLWHGDKSGYVHRHRDMKGQVDDSLADYALCRMLAFWTGKNAARDRLFQRSSLMRQKWDAPSAGGTYGQRTIERAIARVQRTYDPMLRSAQRGKSKHHTGSKQ